jgi:microsomal prostaglandin-E synthase 2
MLSSYMRKAFLGAKGVSSSRERGVILALSAVGLSLIVNKPKSFCSDESKTKSIDKTTVYQYLICPFCNRVKCYLDFCGVKYDTVEVNPLLKSEIKFPGVINKKVPVVVIDGKIIEDSSVIIQTVTQYGNEGSLPNFPSKKFFPDDTEQWNEWSEKKLAVMLYPNITRSWDESWECFSYVKDVNAWSWPMKSLVRVVGTGAMFLANGKIKAKYGIKDERRELLDVINVWSTALNGQKFLHGDEITMPDVLVFGVLNAIDGLTTFRELMKESPQLEKWYKDVAHEISLRANKSKTG